MPTKRSCASWLPARGLGVHVESADIAAQAESSGGNLEEAGREARYAWFGSLIERRVFQRIATGHTRSDQAETVLFRLLRGAGPDGLSSIRPVRAPGVIRPLLAVDRAEVEAFLAERGLRSREDGSNRDLRFARNRIRHELLPQLERDWNPRAAHALARLGEQAAEDAAYWEARVECWEVRLLRPAPGGLAFRLDEVARLEPALRRRLLRRALERVGGAGRYDFRHVEALRLLAEDPAAGARVSLPGLTADALLRERSGSARGRPKPAPLQPSSSRPASMPRRTAAHASASSSRRTIPRPGAILQPDWVAVDWSSRSRWCCGVGGRATGFGRAPAPSCAS